MAARHGVHSVQNNIDHLRRLGEHDDCLISIVKSDLWFERFMRQLGIEAVERSIPESLRVHIEEHGISAEQYQIRRGLGVRGAGVKDSGDGNDCV